MFRGSSDELYLLEEFPENGDEKNLDDSEELLTGKQSPILYSISNMDLESDRVQEKRLLAQGKKDTPTGVGRASFNIPDGRDPSDLEIASSSFGVAEKTINDQEDKIDPSMDFVDKALDIVALIEKKK